MPAQSQAQRGYLAHKFGPEWLKKHHFDNKGKLPQYVKGSDAAHKRAAARKAKQKP